MLGHSCSLQRGRWGWGGHYREQHPTIIDCGDVDLGPSGSPYPYILASLMMEGMLPCYEKRNQDTNPVTKAITYNQSCLQIYWGSGSAELGAAKQGLVRLEAHERKSDTTWMARSQRLDNPDAYGRTKHNWQEKKISEMIPEATLLHSQVGALSRPRQRGFLW